ncbi:Kinesin-like protein KIF20A [Eufriesea mexicana]|nr:Kinesin-like protein KIF20A [Eufriesea mexicana]
MDNTLDSIRPSYNTNPQDEMSYLFGRDPSILAYGQRPCVSNDTKKNLLSVYETEECNYVEESSSLNSESQTVKVYLRIKPFPKKLKLSQEQQEAYKIISSTTLVTKLPTLDNNTSSLKRSNSTDILCRKFTFTKTFGPETTQLELFEQAIKQQMVDFLTGQNSTIMTYGTTNSGKSYTLQGTTTSPGMIPRCLEFVFSNITSKPIPSYKPVNHCDVVILDPVERAQELEIKTKLLTFASVDKHQYINAYKEMQKLLQEESPVRSSQCIDDHYSVWVSFAEIYNEIVYDLLSNECQKKRTPLKLATDGQGRTFIKGLRTICVNSGSEAYQVLMAGQYNLKVAATALNARSSRSHCIFTIKLLKYCIENDPSLVEVSTFAFCDLAGSERLKKTLNIGDRLKEAQNINTSLLVLGRCLKTIHEGQLSKPKLEHGPFRESKLTRLFQKALSGREHMVLIVNINPIPNLYIETQNVLNFSAIAKKIVIEKEKVHRKKKSRFSKIVTQSIKTVTDWDATELESEDWQNIVDDNAVSEYTRLDNYNELINENERLKKEIAFVKSSALTRDLQIRQEMADTYTSMMKELETEWKNRIKDVEEQQEDVLQWSVKQVEDFYKHKLDQLNSRKRRRSSESVSNPNDDSINIKELEVENSRLTSKIVLLKNNVKELKEINQTLTVEKNKVTFELGLIKEDLKNVKNLLNAAQQDVCSDEDTKYYNEELKSQLFAKQEQIKECKKSYDSFKDEKIVIKEELCSDLKVEIITEDSNKNNKDTQTEYIVETQMDEKLLTINKENSALKEKLMRSTTEIQNLKHELEFAKVQLKEISDQILNLKMNNKQPEIKNEENMGHKIIVETVEVGCQVYAEFDEYCTETSKNDVYNKSCQTIENLTKEENNPTSFIDQTDDYEVILDQLAKLLIKYDDIKTQYKGKCLVEELDREILLLKQRIEKLSEESGTSKNDAEKYKQSTELFQKELSLIKEDKMQIQEALKNTDAIKSSLEMKISDYERRLNETEQQFSLKKNDYNQCTEKLGILQANFDTHISEVFNNLQKKYEETINNLQKELSSAVEKSNIKSQCLDVHAAKIIELEHNLGNLTELQEKIYELNKNLETCQSEKDQLQKLLDENNDKLLELEDCLEHAEEKDREKDAEIITLQKEMKNMIQTNENDDKSDKLMEMEMKNTIRDLIATKEMLSKKQKYIEQLEVQVKKSEQNAKIDQIEKERLRTMNEELKNTLIEKEREMESFMKNRDEMVAKYESLVNKNHSKEKDYCENISEDEVVLKERRVRRPPKKFTPSSPKQDEISVIDLSSSDSKRSAKRINLPPPEQVSEKKKSNRKKKLFVTEDESLQDIEPVENSITVTPMAQSRTLRSRRK